MRSLFLDHYRHAHRSIFYYLILSHAFQVFGQCQADTSLDNLEPIKKLMNNGKYDSALQQFQEAISNDPYNHLTYFKRATVFLALDKPESALEDLNKALEIDKDFTPALSQRASLHAKLGNLDQARNDHEQLVKHRPEVSEILIDKRLRSKNYASVECAKVVETNPEAKKASHIINEMIDEYMLNPCKAKIWFVIELCETIQATHIELANYELFSSTPKDFTVYFSDTLPALDWKLVGQFTANDSRTLQAFDLNQVGFGKFIRVELHTHYGNEHYCPISQVKVFGTSMVDEYEKSENLVDNNLAILSSRNTTSSQKSKIKTSAYLVYHKMMTESQNCGLSRSPDEKESDVTSIRQKEKPSALVNLPQPTQQPVVNRTTPLKPSIFVELSNKVKALETASEALMKAQKALETTTKNAKEELRITMNEFDTKLERLYLCLKVSALIVISMLVYKLMLDLM